MTEAWSGDGRYLLPARKVEPYRPWFEFLKAACQDLDIAVDRRLYADWGDVEDLSFDDWWRSGIWRVLFAIDTAVSIVEPGSALDPTDGTLIVRLPLGRDPKETLRDVRDLLEEHGASGLVGSSNRGRFRLSDGVEHGFLHANRLASVRLMLRLYRAWIDHRENGTRERVQAAAMDVYDWGRAWNEKVRANRWKRDLTYLPICFTTWVGYLRRENRREVWEGDDPESARRQVQRYISRARAIAANVARGEFPGVY
jgi:hypothetical protein